MEGHEPWSFPCMLWNSVLSTRMFSTEPSWRILPLVSAFARMEEGGPRGISSNSPRGHWMLQHSNPSKAPQAVVQTILTWQDFLTDSPNFGIFCNLGRTMTLQVIQSGFLISFLPHFTKISKKKPGCTFSTFAWKSPQLPKFSLYKFGFP